MQMGICRGLSCRCTLTAQTETQAQTCQSVTMRGKTDVFMRRQWWCDQTLRKSRGKGSVDWGLPCLVVWQASRQEGRLSKETLARLP